MVVCVGATLVMMTNEYLCEVYGTGDVARLGAQVINGIGFLGAGTVIVTGRLEVKGLTTAAGLWASACMGLAIGAGFYECAAVGFIYMIFTFVIFNHLEKFVVSRTRNMDFYIEYDRTDSLPDIIATIKQMNVRVYSVDINKVKNGNYVTRSAVFSVRLPKKTVHSALIAVLAKKSSILLIDEI